jgi:hypothetical protein
MAGNALTAYYMRYFCTAVKGGGERTGALKGSICSPKHNADGTRGVLLFLAAMRRREGAILVFQGMPMQAAQGPHARYRM